MKCVLKNVAPIIEVISCLGRGHGTRICVLSEKGVLASGHLP